MPESWPTGDPSRWWPVAVAGRRGGGQALALGLIDEVAMDVVPVVVGSGKRYFRPVDRRHLPEGPDVVIQGSRVPHSAVVPGPRPGERVRAFALPRPPLTGSTRCRHGRVERMDASSAWTCRLHGRVDRMDVLTR
jgi:hypothetical protein